MTTSGCVAGRRLGLVLGGFLLSAMPAAAAPCGSTESCLQAIDAAHHNTNTVSADFTQVKHVSLLAEPIESRGRFVFKRPDRLRLQVDQPQAATVIIHGRDVEIPGLPAADRQALALAPIGTMFRQLGGMFSGAFGELGKDFDVSAQSGGGASPAIEVVLVPRAAPAQRMFRRIVVRFVGSDLTVSELRMEDGFGDRLEIALTNVRRNVEVPDATFTVSPP